MGEEVRGRVLESLPGAPPDRCAASDLTCNQVAERFVAWVRSTVGDRPAIVITDNCAFDIGLLKAFSPVDTSYLLGKRTMIVDTMCVYLGCHALSKRVRFDPRMQAELSSKRVGLAAVAGPEARYPTFPCNHDHNPENDAATIAYHWCHVQDNLPAA